jgi:hypothetical protein
VGNVYLEWKHVGDRRTYEVSAWHVDHGRRRLGMQLFARRTVMDKTCEVVVLVVLGLEGLIQLWVRYIRLAWTAENGQ